MLKSTRLHEPEAKAQTCSLERLEIACDATGRAVTAPFFVDSLVEYHANIGCYQCVLFQNEKLPLDMLHCYLRVTFPRLELVYHCPSDGSPGAATRVAWWTVLERHVDLSHCSLENRDDHWYLRLPIRPRDKQPLSGFASFTQVSAKELQPQQYATMSCRHCNTEVLKRKIIDKVLPLPSANWMDMVDFWGAGSGAFEHIRREVIQAQKHRVLVGESYVLLHASDVEADAIVPICDLEVTGTIGRDATEKGEDVPLMCAACFVPVGLSSLKQPETFRLGKHLIRAHKCLERVATGQEEDDNVFTTYTVDSILCAKLLEQADAEGTFRFLLHSGTSTTQLFMQLVSWETMIKQHHATSFRRVLKVLYGPRQPILNLLPSHQLSLPPLVYSAIVQRLETSSTLLPLSLRTFNRMSVGYLYA